MESTEALEHDAVVLPGDVSGLPVLHELLRTLNDSHAGAPALARSVERFRPLRARIVLRFRERFPARQKATLPEQIAALGNHELEAILLGLLEDLTMVCGKTLG